MPAPRKIALFGGTFDPVHLGHIRIAQQAKDVLGLDEIRFLPCRISPHKTDTRPADGANRCEMLRLATAGLPWAVIDDFELHQAGPSYSFETAEAMAQRFPDARLFWILGGDQWKSLPKWKHPERLARAVEFIVLARGEAPASREGCRLHIIPGEQHPASSTEIREAISHGEIYHPWLDTHVAEWIIQNGLYQP